MENEKELQYWRGRTDALQDALNEQLDEEMIDLEELCIFIQDASGAVLRGERFLNPYSGTDLEPVLTELYHYIQLCMQQAGAVAMISIQASLVQAGAIAPGEFVEYLYESILAVKGLVSDEAYDGDENEADSELEDHFNGLLDKAENAAAEENYKDAIRYLDEAFAVAEKEPMLFYDRGTMINNRAFYNCQLGHLEEALHDADRALAEMPDDALVYHTRAEILVAMKQYRLALEAIDKAIELEDDDDKQEYRRMILGKL